MEEREEKPKTDMPVQAPPAQKDRTLPGKEAGPRGERPAQKNGNGANGRPCAAFEKVEKGAATAVKPYTADQVCEPPARTFMVALRPNQPPLKLQADDPAEFVPYLKTTSLAWVNCRVGDLATEAPAVASSLGFSTGLVESLLQSRHSGYEDRESEMGMMLPAIRVEKLTVHGYQYLILLKDGIIFTVHGE